jgi:hypothetical protein
VNRSFESCLVALIDCRAGVLDVLPLAITEATLDYSLVESDEGP